VNRKRQRRNVAVRKAASPRTFSPFPPRFVEADHDGGQQILDDAALCGFDLGLHGPRIGVRGRHAGFERDAALTDVDVRLVQLDAGGVNEAALFISQQLCTVTGIPGLTKPMSLLKQLCTVTGIALSPEYCHRNTVTNISNWKFCACGTPVIFVPPSIE
jgi:hypothetical protein